MRRGELPELAQDTDGGHPSFADGKSAVQTQPQILAVTGDQAQGEWDVGLEQQCSSRRFEHFPAIALLPLGEAPNRRPRQVWEGRAQRLCPRGRWRP